MVRDRRRHPLAPLAPPVAPSEHRLAEPRLRPVITRRPRLALRSAMIRAWQQVRAARLSADMLAARRRERTRLLRPAGRDRIGVDHGGPGDPVQAIKRDAKEYVLIAAWTVAAAWNPLRGIAVPDPQHLTRAPDTDQAEPRKRRVAAVSARAPGTGSGPDDAQAHGGPARPSPPAAGSGPQPATAHPCSTWKSCSTSLSASSRSIARTTVTV